MNDIIVYRSPIEKMFWDGIMAYPLEIFLVASFFIIVVLGYIFLGEFFKRHKFHKK